MFDWIYHADAWILLATLTALEIVLGIDNIIFLAILVGKLPKQKQDLGRVLGLGFALLTRICLLVSLFWVMKLTKPLFSVFGLGISGRDLILILGGLFLVYKSCQEIKGEILHKKDEEPSLKPSNSLVIIVAQIALLDIVFSLDSVITAVGIAQDIVVMILAVVIAMFVMLFASKPIAYFVQIFPNIKILALVFLVLIGIILLCEGFGVHIDKKYLYCAMGFSLIVELLNIWAKNIKHN